MITLITGVPGSGKSLYAVKLILEFLKEGRTVFADIDGLNIDGVQSAPEDWRDTPDGSVVVYDECQQRFGPDGQGRAKNPSIQALEVHRHTGHDLVFITQRERLLHAHIRDLVGRHYHIQRQYGSHNVKIFRRDEAIDTKSKSALNSCDQTLWRYDKKLFDCYKSATVHTHKTSLPTWLKVSGAVALLGVIAFGFFLYQSIGFWTGETLADTVADAGGIVRSGSDPLVVEVTRGRRPLNGCVVWAQETECRCHDIDGRTVDSLSFQQCMIHARGSTLNFHSPAGYEKRGREAPEAKARSSGGPSSAPSASVVM